MELSAKILIKLYMKTYYYLDKALRSLTKNELKSFEKYLHSPYFKIGHVRIIAIRKLFRHIRKQIDKNTIKSDIYWNLEIRKLFPEKALEEKIWKKFVINMKSDLLFLILNFFAIERLIRDKAYYGIAILEELDSRKLPDIFDHFCKTKDFNGIEELHNGHQEFYNSWKLFQTVMKDRLKNSSSIDNIHLVLEKMLLNNFYKKEIELLENRINDFTENQLVYNRNK